MTFAYWIYHFKLIAGAQQWPSGGACSYPLKMCGDFVSPSSEAAKECIFKKIQNVKSIDSSEIGLESINLCKIPEDLLQLHQLQRISLYGNQLDSLPETFYNSFPQLTWLDLRYNRLHCISRSINRLQCLVNLLVGNNNISRLCLELGGIESLIGLHFEGNPLIFPSQDILLKGPSHVLDYLKNCNSKRIELERTSS